MALTRSSEVIRHVSILRLLRRARVGEAMPYLVEL